MEHPRVSGRDLLKALGAWLVVGGGIYGLLILFGRVLARRFYLDHVGDVEALFLLAAYVALFAALWWAFGGWAGLRDRLGFRFTSAGHLLAALPLWLLTVVVGAAVSVPFSRLFGPPQSNASALVRAAHDPVATTLLVAGVVVVAPFCEELLFRGALFGWLRGRIAVVLAAPVSAAIFAAAHVFPPGFVLLFVFGLSAALLYERTGSTLNSFVMHACQNTAAVVALYTGLAGR